MAHVELKGGLDTLQRPSPALRRAKPILDELARENALLDACAGWRNQVCAWARRKFRVLTYHDVEECWNDVLLQLWKQHIDGRNLINRGGLIFGCMALKCSYLARWQFQMKRDVRIALNIAVAYDLVEDQRTVCWSDGGRGRDDRAGVLDLAMQALDGHDRRLLDEINDAIMLTGEYQRFVRVTCELAQLTEGQVKWGVKRIRRAVATAAAAEGLPLRLRAPGYGRGGRNQDSGRDYGQGRRVLKGGRYVAA